MSAARVRFGRLFFGINLLTFVGYLVCLTSFLIVTYPGKLDRHTGCSYYLTDADSYNNSHFRQVRFLFATGYLCVCSTTVCNGTSECYVRLCTPDSGLTHLFYACRRSVV